MELAKLPINIAYAKTAELCRGRVLLLGYPDALPSLPFLIAVHALPVCVLTEDASKIKDVQNLQELKLLENYCRFIPDGGNWRCEPSFDTVVLTNPSAFGLSLRDLLTMAFKISNPDGRIVLAFPPSEAKDTIAKHLEAFLSGHNLKITWREDSPKGWLLGHIDKAHRPGRITPPQKLPLSQCPEKVTVIIPTYNRAGWLVQAIESLLNQTYSNIEIIVVDHGSTDDTRDVLEHYRHEIRAIYVENTPESPKGPSPAINAGLEAATGKYICRLDDDDLFLPLKVELQVKAFREAPEDVGLVHSQFFLIDETKYLSYVPRAYFGRTETRLYLLSANRLTQPTVMVKRECHEKVGFYDESISIVEDYDMWVRILRYYDLRYIPLPLAKYRIHGSNSSSSHNGRYLAEGLQSLHRKLLRLDLLSEFFQDLEELRHPEERKLLLARAFTSRGEGALRWGLREEALEEFRRAEELYPGILHLYREKWARWPSLWKGLDIYSVKLRRDVH